MAKKTEEVNATVTATEEVNASAEPEEKEKLVEVELFKDSKDYKDDVFVCINGRNMVIKRGVKVKIPEAYAKVLDQSLKQDAATAKLMDSKQDEFASEVRARNI